MKKTNMVKKSTALLLILSMAAASMTGCGKDGGGGKDGGSKTAAGTTAGTAAGESTTQGAAGAEGSTSATEPAAQVDPYAPIEGKEYKITWTANIYEMLDEHPKMVEYWEDKFGIDIEFIPLDAQNWDEQLNILISGGTIPDKIRMANTDKYRSFVDQGVLAGIPEEVIQKYAPNIYGFYEKEAPLALKNATVDGKIYGLPIYKEDTRLRQGLFWRGDYLETLGVEAPSTIEEMESVLQKIRDEDPDGNGQKDTYGISQTAFASVYGAYGCPPNIWMNQDGKLIYSSVQPEVKDALTTLSRWYEEGYIDPEFITGENKGGYWAISTVFATGRVAASQLGNYYHWGPLAKGATVDEMKLANPDAYAIIGPLPAGPDGKKGMPVANLYGGSFDGFSVNLEKEPDKLGKILQFMDSFYEDLDSFYTMRFGIEGEMWELQENGAPGMIGEYKEDPTRQAKSGAGTMFQSITPFEYMDTLSPENWAWGKENGLDQDFYVNELYSTLPSAAKYQTDLQNMQDEYFQKIITGEWSVDKFDEFVEKWYSLGGTTLVEEANAWWDTFQ